MSSKQCLTLSVCSCRVRYYFKIRNSSSTKLFQNLLLLFGPATPGSVGGGEWLLRCPESRPGLSSFPERRTTAKRGKDKKGEGKRGEKVKAAAGGRRKGKLHCCRILTVRCSLLFCSKSCNKLAKVQIGAKSSRT